VILLLLVGLGMTALCLALQVWALELSQRYFVHAKQRPKSARPGRAFIRTSIVLALLMLGIVVQMMAWAALYRLGGLMATSEEALYFSGVTFTSLGYGDIVLHGNARFLAPMEAATGLMMFAIVTAVLIAVIQQEMKDGL
jgi:hypothetical protein